MYKKVLTQFDTIKAENQSSSIESLVKNRTKTIIRISIADDENDIQEEIIEVLNKLKEDLAHLAEIEFFIAKNGFEAFNQNKKTPADIVYTDIRMPIMDGYNYCLKARKDIPEMENTPFVFVSQEVSQTENELKAYKLGAVKVFSKPINDPSDPEKVKKFYDHALNLCIQQLKIKAEKSKSKLLEEAIFHYVNKGIVLKTLEQGFIDKNFYDATIGIVFGDICRSSEIENKLTPFETGILLNGYYTLIYEQVEQYQGYYNKSIGDGFFVTFGGPLDKTLQPETAQNQIAERIFDFCISAQRALNDFNNQKYQSSNPEYQREIDLAYEVFSNKLKEKEVINLTMRLGACQGHVVVGDFGPQAFRQYDAVSQIVNLGARLQSLAKERGVCLHQSVCENLSSAKISNYMQEFTQKSRGYYQKATHEDIYQFRFEIAKGFPEKIPTYAVEPLYNLPEIIKDQIENYLELGPTIIPEIKNLIELYLNNKYVLKAIDDLFLQKKIRIRRLEIFKILYPEKYKEIQNNPEELQNKNRTSLYSLLKRFTIIENQISNLKDQLSQITINLEENNVFNYDSLLAEQFSKIDHNYRLKKQIVDLETELADSLKPKIFAHIQASFLEYFNKGALKE